MTVFNSQLNGLLVVDKPGRRLWHDWQGAVDAAAARLPDRDDPYLPTSHDVVSRVRRWSGQRRIGHTGTLDPMASGVLVLCLGNATRLVEYHQGETKKYYAEVQLGRATDSYDIEGNLTATGPVPRLNAAEIDRRLDQFRGAVWQVPPAYAAIKQGGEALYAKARRGERVTVEARRVVFHELVLLDFPAPDQILLRIRCSAGAYIRSLAHDLGMALGTHALLAGLRREAVGSFTLADAHSMAAIQAAAQAGRVSTLLLPPGDGLPLPAVTFPCETLRRLGYGQTVSIAVEDAAGEAEFVQVRNADGHLIGIARRLSPAADTEDSPPAWLWKAEKWLM